MLALGTLLFVVLTFVAALISGAGVWPALVIAAVMVGAFFVSHRHAGGRNVRS
jgi:hypothetical protein